MPANAASIKTSSTISRFQQPAGTTMNRPAMQQPNRMGIADQQQFTPTTGLGLNPGIPSRVGLPGAPNLMGSRGVANVVRLGGAGIYGPGGNWGFTTTGAAQQQQQHLQQQAATRQPPHLAGYPLFQQQQQQQQQQHANSLASTLVGSPMGSEVLDMSEFPALGSTMAPSSTGVPNSLNGSGSMFPGLKQQVKEEFSLEDFPALPGAGTTASATSGPTASITPQQQEQRQQMQTQPQMAGQDETSEQPFQRPSTSQPLGSESDKSYATKASLNAPTTTYTSTPSSVPPRSSSPTAKDSTTPVEDSSGSWSDADRFGLLGLQSVIQTTDSDLNTLALGNDLTNLGLNLNSVDALYSSFSTPFTENTQNVYIEPEYHLPPCYAVQPPVPAQTKVGTFSDETLFFIFYSMPKDLMQETAAQELYNRNWRYHKDLRLWLTKEPGTEPTAKTAAYERGNYIFFDPSNWEKVKKEYVLMYESLEERPNSMMNGGGVQQGMGGGSNQLNLPGFQLAAAQQQAQQQQQQPPPQQQQQYSTPGGAGRLLHHQQQQQQAQQTQQQHQRQQQAMLHGQLQHHPGYATHLQGV